MRKTRLLSSSNKFERSVIENDAENVTKLRTSAYGRFTKTGKTPSSLFQVRRPLNSYMIEKLNSLGRKTYFQRVHVLARNVEKDGLKEQVRSSSSKSSDCQQSDYREYLQLQFDKIFASCEEEKCSPDQLTGFLIVMGRTHTYVMIEGAEDMVSNFVAELVLAQDTFWTSSRVFLVEDKIGPVG